VGEVQPQHKDQDIFHDYYAHIPNIVLACSCFLGVCQIMWSFIDDNLAYKIGQIARSDPDPQECAKWVAQYILNSNKILYYLGVIMCDVLLAVGTLAILYVVNDEINNILWNHYAKFSFSVDDGALFPYTVHCRYVNSSPKHSVCNTNSFPNTLSIPTQHKLKSYSLEFKYEYLYLFTAIINLEHMVDMTMVTFNAHCPTTNSSRNYSPFLCNAVLDCCILWLLHTENFSSALSSYTTML
jgi:hypothetical protein